MAFCISVVKASECHFGAISVPLIFPGLHTEYRRRSCSLFAVHQGYNVKGDNIKKKKKKHVPFMWRSHALTLVFDECQRQNKLQLCMFSLFRFPSNPFFSFGCRCFIPRHRKTKTQKNDVASLNMNDNCCVYVCVCAPCVCVWKI